MPTEIETTKLMPPSLLAAPIKAARCLQNDLETRKPTANAMGSGTIRSRQKCYNNPLE